MWCFWALAEGSMFCTNSSLGHVFNHFLAWTSLAILFNHFLASWTSLATVFVNILIVTTFCHSQVYHPTFAFGWVNKEIKSQPAFMIELKSSFFATIFAGKLFQVGQQRSKKAFVGLFSISQFLIGNSILWLYTIIWHGGFSLFLNFSLASVWLYTIIWHGRFSVWTAMTRRCRHVAAFSFCSFDSVNLPCCPLRIRFPNSSPSYCFELPCILVGQSSLAASARYLLWLDLSACVIFQIVLCSDSKTGN